jgi:hypothetical protein
MMRADGRPIAIAVRRLKPQNCYESVKKWIRENWLKRNHDAYTLGMLLNAPRDVVYMTLDARKMTKKTVYIGYPIEQIFDEFDMSYAKEWLKE